MPHSMRCLCFVVLAINLCIVYSSISILSRSRVNRSRKFGKLTHWKRNGTAYINWHTRVLKYRNAEVSDNRCTQKIRKSERNHTEHWIMRIWATEDGAKIEKCISTQNENCSHRAEYWFTNDTVTITSANACAHAERKKSIFKSYRSTNIIPNDIYIRVLSSTACSGVHYFASDFHFILMEATRAADYVLAKHLFLFRLCTIAKHSHIEQKWIKVSASIYSRTLAHTLEISNKIRFKCGYSMPNNGKFVAGEPVRLWRLVGFRSRHTLSQNVIIARVRWINLANSSSTARKHCCNAYNAHLFS